MTFDATYQGKVYAMQSGIVYDLIDGAFRGTGIEDYNVRVALTGYTATSSKGSVGYQTMQGGYVILSEGWENVGVVPVNRYSQSAAQALVNKIIKNNITILQNNLVCARYASRFSQVEQQRIRDLQNRLTVRNEALQSQGLTTNVQTSYPKGYAELNSYLDALMAGETIGVATWVVVVIVATIIAATATAAYYAYKTFADESEQDVKFSKELMQVLTTKLTPEEYEQLLNETKGFVTKSKILEAARGIFNSNTLKWIAGAILAGAVAVRLLKQ